MKTPIANLADFSALDPFFRIIEQGLDGLAGPGHFFDLSVLTLREGEVAHWRDYLEPGRCIRCAWLAATLTGPERAAGER